MSFVRDDGGRASLGPASFSRSLRQVSGRLCLVSSVMLATTAAPQRTDILGI
jgi:hypothetical protein